MQVTHIHIQFHIFSQIDAIGQSPRGSVIFYKLLTMARGELAPRLSLVSPKFFFFFILSQREFWFLAAVASGLLSWGHLISSDYRQFDFTDTI